ncbi:thiamine phosphate synthase [Legionella cardiaca]|uniref:Thiamine-phosphate synthase n=1 Tax=Legionella cardiaca TaxID=1071983 RepID=A0ABY8ATG1_9GAMM|nr:thiamine phosphate synthase [Legionella cardiaca]WED43769.1 thiamine phosphate synthase [Legionella cardiaca]
MRKPTVWITGYVESQEDLTTSKHLRVDARRINVNELLSINFSQNALKPDALKISGIETVSYSRKMIPFLKNFLKPIVLDPCFMLLSAKPSDRKQQRDNLVNLLPFVEIITLSLTEAEKILNRPIFSYQDIEEAAYMLLTMGAKSVLLKGNAIKNLRQNFWTNGHESFWIANMHHSEINNWEVDGALSAAITACLALGYSIKDAIVIATMYFNRGLRKASQIARFFHDDWPEEQADLPYLSPKPLEELPQSFKAYQMNLYPVVDSSLWLEKLLPQGVKCIQLRIKNAGEAILEKEIKRSIYLAKQYDAKLFVNDYWDLAIRFGADGVHLGQEDLQQADINKIRCSGLYLGVSTHCYYEVARAHALKPSYIACGPIYSTTSKAMVFQPQGIEQLQRWRRMLQYPLVAIGGINLERLADVLKSGVRGVSLISAITQANDPLETTRQFLTKINEASYE